MAASNSQKPYKRPTTLKSQSSRRDTPPRSQRTQISQLLESGSSNDPLGLTRSGAGKRRHVESRGSYSDMESDDSDAANTPPPASKRRKVGAPLATSTVPKQSSSTSSRPANKPSHVPEAGPSTFIAINTSQRPLLAESASHRTILKQKSTNASQSQPATYIRKEDPRPRVIAATARRPVVDSQSSNTLSADSQSALISQPVTDDTSNIFIEYNKTEADAFRELELYARQEFCVSGFDRDCYTPVIERVFPGMSSTNVIYGKAVKKVRNNFKNWRFRTLAAAREWVNRLCLTDESTSRLRTDYNFLSLRNKINNMYDQEWLGEVFGFVGEIIDFKSCTELGALFLRYAFVIIVVHARLTYLQERYPLDTRIEKYTRIHELDTFDALTNKKEFKGKLSRADFPLRVARSFRRTVRSSIDLDDDPDAELGVDFYADSTTPESNPGADEHEEEVDDLLDDGLSGYSASSVEEQLVENSQDEDEIMHMIDSQHAATAKAATAKTAATKTTATKATATKATITKAAVTRAAPSAANGRSARRSRVIVDESE